MRFIAVSASYVFHPIFVLFYIFLCLKFISPVDFIFSEAKQEIALYGMVLGLSVFFPLVSILALRASGLLPNLKMSETKDRIGPMISTIIFYMWLFLNYRQFNLGPDIYTANILGALISLFLAFFINNFSKISLHAVGMGGLIGASVVFRAVFESKTYAIPMGLIQVNLSSNIFLIIIILISGLVGSSRLFLRVHRPIDIYSGYFVGFISQLLAITVHELI